MIGLDFATRDAVAGSLIPGASGTFLVCDSRGSWVRASAVLAHPTIDLRAIHLLEGVEIVTVLE
jgi:hypothetical protein